MIADASTSTPSDAGEATKSSSVGALVEHLKSIGAIINDIGSQVSGIGGFEAIGEPLKKAGSTLSKVADGLSSVGTGFDEGKEKGGAVGGLLGGLGAGLEAASGLFGGGGEEGEKSFVDKAAGAVSKLSEIWNKYYDDILNKDGEVSAKKLGNLALEVGETILGSKKMAKVKKAIAVANILRNNAEAISKAAAALPPPFNAVLIAAAKALGSKLLGSVQGQAHDGLDRIPSTGTYLLEKGERVVGKRLNADLSGFLRANTATSNTTAIDRSQTSSSQFNPTINMRFEGGADQMAISDSRGQVERMIREIYADYAQTSPFGA